MQLSILRDNMILTASQWPFQDYYWQFPQLMVQCVSPRVDKRWKYATAYPCVYSSIFLKWRSKMPHVGMVTLLIFWRNARILLTRSASSYILGITLCSSFGLLVENCNDVQDSSAPPAKKDQEIVSVDLGHSGAELPSTALQQKLSSTLLLKMSQVALRWSLLLYLLLHALSTTSNSW